MKTAAIWATALILAVGFAASAGAQTESARGKFKNSEGKEVGTVTLTHMPSTTLILLDLHDMPPGVHGIHIHAVGRCEAPSFDSAGPHYNPTSKEHGSLNPKGKHGGDLANITIPANGKLETSITLDGPIQWQEAGGILDGDGASIVIHANADDYKTDPSGNSGARIACARLDLDQSNN